MSDINDQKLIGIIGRNPELNQRQGQNGPYNEVSFSLAIERTFGDKTDWYNCRLAGKRANVIKDYFHKGNSIIVVGHMESYKKDGDNTVHWIFRMSDFSFNKITQRDVDDFLARKNRSTNGNSASTTSTDGAETSAETSMEDSFEQIDVDVPF